MTLDIMTPAEKLPTIGFSIVIGAPVGFPIRDNRARKIIATCTELDQAKRIVRALSLIQSGSEQ